MYTLERGSLGYLSLQRTECCLTAVSAVSNQILFIYRTATVGENIDLEGEVGIEEFTCFVVELTANPKAAKVVDMTDEAVDIIPCLLRDAKQICLRLRPCIGHNVRLL